MDADHEQEELKTGTAPASDNHRKTGSSAWVYSLLWLVLVVLVCFGYYMGQAYPATLGDPQPELSRSGLATWLSLIGCFLMPIATIPAGFGLVTLALSRGKKLHVAFALLACALGVALPVGVRKLTVKIRHEAFVGVANRGAPLVEAIRRYEKENGEQPSKLDDLVPRYLQDIPGTGLRGYPEFVYWQARQGEWLLEMRCRSGLKSSEKLVYRPSGEYPRKVFGAEAVPIGAWAYLAGH